jgi:hypothetical protein
LPGTRSSQTKAPEPGHQSVAPSRRDAVSDWLDLFVRLLGLPASESAQVLDELEDHLRSRVDDLLITGASEPEAVRRAVAELGETASLAQGFRHARRNPRRRFAMHAALFIVAGSALALSSTALFTGWGNTATQVPAAANASVSEAVVTVIDDQFGETLHKYDVRDLVFADEPLVRTSEGEALIETISSLVGVDDWQRNGGDIAQLHLVGNTLFVNAPSELQEGVQWVIESLIEDAEALHAQQEKEEQAEMAEEMREREERMQVFEAQLEELKTSYEQLRERLIELSRQQVRMEFEEEALDRQMDESPDDESVREALANSAAERTRLDLEREDVESRISRVRQTLIELEMRTVLGRQ